MGYELSYDIIAINRFSGVFEDMEKTLQKMQQCVATLNLSVEQLSESLAQAGSSASEHFKGFDAHFGNGITGMAVL
jgi:hypothetical protein